MKIVNTKTHLPHFLASAQVVGDVRHKISFDWHSITALIELWHPKTHTFIFPKFEATVLLEEVEAFLALPKTKPGDEQSISYTVEPINPKFILGEFMTDPGDVHTMVSPQFIHLVPLSKWVISKCKDKSVDHREIAKAVAICLQASMAMRRAPLASMDGETAYEGSKRARTTYEALMRVTSVPNHFSRSEEVRELFSGSLRYSKLNWIAPMIKSLPMFVIRFLREWGLGGVLIAAHNFQKISFDWHSITALIELWHLQTHTFIFPKFEATVLLEEVEAFLALPKTKPGDEQSISYTVEPINPKFILG
ncbi:hypothetical protein Taro_050815 [Colocasia esculenta]|uniref:Aminotransferase-like plant mobile domain-containing protein n=1 Tax=Colocasia esculenta TaxID=4460 RepID=A0A843XEZ2_COLES|nr:hypothetical protein [Colocasia esculenta]